MPCLHPDIRAKYTTELARVRTQISNLSDALDSALENSEVEEYSFNSGEGSQKTVRRDIDKMIKSLDRLEAKEARIMKKLLGRGVVNLNLRRKRYGSYYR